MALWSLNLLICILYGFPFEMDFSLLRQVVRNLNGKPYIMLNTLHKVEDHENHVRVIYLITVFYIGASEKYARRLNSPNFCNMMGGISLQVISLLEATVQLTNLIPGEPFFIFCICSFQRTADGGTGESVQAWGWCTGYPVREPRYTLIMRLRYVC